MTDLHEVALSSNKDPSKVREMFKAVAPAYDRTNDILSMGLHHLWRKKLVARSGVRSGESVLDCATGTGDLAIEFKKAVGETGTVVGSDFCPEMLVYAPEKARAKSLKIKFEIADAMNLPYAPLSFDVVSIAFGIRNVSGVQQALSEMVRVLRHGGRLAILEFGQPTLWGWKHFYNYYSKALLPKIGGAVSGQAEAYAYLQKSSAVFPSGQQFVELMEQCAGIQRVEVTSLMGGVAFIYVGYKS